MHVYICLFIFVFFIDAKSGCKTCSKVLDELEKIDHEAEAEGIHIVKIDDTAFAKKYGVFAFPAILFFRGPESEPIIYAGKNISAINFKIFKGMKFKCQFSK